MVAVYVISKSVITQLWPDNIPTESRNRAASLGRLVYPFVIMVLHVLHCMKFKNQWCFAVNYLFLCEKPKF